MKNVIYIHQYFKTPEEGGALRSYHISKEMVARGIDVDMITSHNKWKYEKKLIDGIHVHYLPIQYSHEFSFAKRSTSFVKFAVAAIRLSIKLQKPDLLYVTSTPLTVGLIAIWLKWSRKIQYIFEVRDLWPEAPIQLGLLKSPLIKYLLVKLENITYKNATKIIALSPGIERGIIIKEEQANIRIVPNMADVDFFHDKQANISAKKDFVIGYFGAFGLANNLEYILEVARECQNENLEVRFKLVGEGARKKSLECTAKQWNLKNIEILSYQNRFEIRELMIDVDACFTSFLNVPILETNSPNKFFDGLAAGKLSIVNTKGWLKALVEDYQCGFYVDPDKPENFPHLIKPFLDDENLLKSWQDNALQLAMKRFSRQKLVDDVCDFVLSQD